MLQQVIVKAETGLSIKPLLQSAIQSELKVLAHGIQRTNKRLTGFEEQFSFSSEDFERKYSAGELEESLDFIDWFGEIKTLHLLQDQEKALQEIEIS